MTNSYKSACRGRDQAADAADRLSKLQGGKLVARGEGVAAARGKRK